MHIDEDRWFKLRVDNWVLGIQRISDPRKYSYTSRDIHNTVPWYERDIFYPQAAKVLVQNSPYTIQEVEDHLRGRVAAAKLEALLDRQ